MKWDNKKQVLEKKEIRLDWNDFFQKIIEFCNKKILKDLINLYHYIIHFLIKLTIIPYRDWPGKIEMNRKGLKWVQLTGKK